MRLSALNLSLASCALFAQRQSLLRTTSFIFPAIQAKLAAGQRAQLSIVGDSNPAGWGAEIAVGTGTGNQALAGTPGYYSRAKSWPGQWKNKLNQRGIVTRHDAFFSSAIDSNLTNMQAANPNIVVGAGWALGNYSLSGSILQCGNTITTASTYYPSERAADRFDFIVSGNPGLGTLRVTDEDGLSFDINQAVTSGAQVIIPATGNALRRLTVPRPAASTKPIQFARVSGGSCFVEAIIPWDSTSPCLEILNMGWPGSKAYGASGSGHWNIFADPSTMSASTPYNALGALGSDAFIIELGTNDTSQGVSVADYKQAMTNIATKLAGQVGAANVALAKPRTAGGGFNMSAAHLAAIDEVTVALGLAPVLDFNSIAFATDDRFDTTHLTTSGQGKSADKAMSWFLPS